MTKPYIIGIAGGSGSGKTSFLRDIKKEFDSSQVCILSMDDYYQPRENQQTDQKGIKNFDLPTSIDADAFVKDMRSLLRGEEVERLEYVFNNEKATPNKLVFKPAPVIIVEGLFVFYFYEVWELLDLKVFIHTRDVLKVIRRITRDGQERNYPVEDVLYRYEAHVLPAFKKYIKPYEDEVDLIIVNNESYDGGLHVLAGFIKNKLQSQNNEM